LEDDDSFFTLPIIILTKLILPHTTAHCRGIIGTTILCELFSLTILVDLMADRSAFKSLDLIALTTSFDARSTSPSKSSIQPVLVRKVSSKSSNVGREFRYFDDLVFFFQELALLLRFRFFPPLFHRRRHPQQHLRPRHLPSYYYHHHL